MAYTPGEGDRNHLSTTRGPGPLGNQSGLRPPIEGGG